MTDAAGGWAARRGRSASVVAILVGAGGALISSTQTWASAEVASAPIASSGADALPLLQPLALAALALSLALALTGRVVRVILAAVALLIGAGITALAIPVASTAPVSAVESVVTEHTGIAGTESVAEVIGPIALTAWPWIGVASALVLAAGGILALVTAPRWRRAGHRYESAQPTSRAPEQGPLDAVDSWDDLTRGDDPTRPD